MGGAMSTEIVGSQKKTIVGIDWFVSHGGSPSNHCFDNEWSES